MSPFSAASISAGSSGADSDFSESGLGVLADTKTYEIIDPESVGASSRLHLGKHSGRAAFRKRIAEMGVDLGEAEFELAFNRFKDLADRVKTVADDQIRDLVGAGTEAPTSGPFILEHVQFTSGSDIASTATVTVRVNNQSLVRSASAYGPVEAVCRAIDNAGGVQAKLIDYSVKATSAGKDALGEVRVTVEFEGRKAEAWASSVNIIEASARAYVQALNKLVSEKEKKSVEAKS